MAIKISRSKRQNFLHNTLSILFLLLCFIPKPVQAKKIMELNLEELMELKVETVYSASRYQQNVKLAPSSVSIITASDIKHFGYRTLADILKGVRDFYSIYDRNYQKIGIRGFSKSGDYDTRFLLLVNSHRINDSIYSATATGTEFILDMDIIERVEVIRGPSSSLYGTNAFLGVINVLTRKGLHFKGTELSGEAGSLDSHKARMTYGFRNEKGIDALISGTVYRSCGQKALYFREFDAPLTNFGIAREIDGDSYKSTFFSLMVEELNLEGGLINRKKNIPTASYGTLFNSPDTMTQDDRGYLNLSYHLSLDASWNIIARLFYDFYQYKGIWMYPPIYHDLTDGRSWGGEIQFSRTWMDLYHLIFGLGFINDYHQYQGVTIDDPFTIILDDQRGSKNWSAYIQDEWNILKNLTLTMGARYDYYETFGKSANPRLALIYSPFQSSTLKFLYGRAFRAPNVYEMYYNDGGQSLKSNPRLQPEKITSYEMVLEQNLLNSMLASVTIFRNHIDNLISQDSDPSDGLQVFTNKKGALTTGMGLEIEKRWESGFRGKMAYTVQRTENQETGGEQENSPRHLAKFQLLIPLLREKLFLGLEEQYTGKRFTGKGGYADSFLLTNVTISAQGFFKGLEASLSAYNLFNKTYSDPASNDHTQELIEQDGRTIRFKLTWKF